MSESQEKWLVMLPFFDTDTDSVFTTDFKVGPCSEEQMLEFLKEIQTDERRLLAVLRRFGWTSEHDDLVVADEKAEQPLTDAGYIPGDPVFMTMTDLVASPTLEPRSGRLA